MLKKFIAQQQEECNHCHKEIQHGEVIYVDDWESVYCEECYEQQN